MLSDTKVKYVVFNNFLTEVPILVPEMINHNEIKYQECPPISAGYVGWDSEKNKFYCYGESVSLKLKSRPEEDSWLINFMFK